MTISWIGVRRGWQSVAAIVSVAGCAAMASAEPAPDRYKHYVIRSLTGDEAITALFRRSDDNRLDNAALRD